jgi:flagellar basal-body rod protein FlgC
MNVIASNLANASTTKTPEGGPYKRRDVVFESVPASFETALSARMEGAKGVRVAEVTEDERSPRMVYDPSHPDANKDGYVAFPNVNVIEEMTNMMAATRSYESNVAAINAAKSMSMKALEIGK